MALDSEDPIASCSNGKRDPVSQWSAYITQTHCLIGETYRLVSEEIVLWIVPLPVSHSIFVPLAMLLQPFGEVFDQTCLFLALQDRPSPFLGRP